MPPSSLLLYVKQNLSEAIWQLLDSRLRKVPGVIAPWCNLERQHLIFIYYNRTKVLPKRLLKSLRRFGYDARIIDD